MGLQDRCTLSQGYGSSTCYHLVGGYPVQRRMEFVLYLVLVGLLWGQRRIDLLVDSGG